MGGGEEEQGLFGGDPPRQSSVSEITRAVRDFRELGTIGGHKENNC